MPCYLRVKVTLTEKWKVRPDLFGQSLKNFVTEMESVYGKNVNVTIDQTTCIIKVYGEQITVDMKEGTIQFRRGMQDVKNALKRNYSETVVRHAAGNPGIRSKYNLRQTGTREYTLQKRR